MSIINQLAATLVLASTACSSALAVTANSHAPIGVMGDHMHKIGEVMLSYRYMHMDMRGNRDGSDDVSATEIATTVPNRFFGAAGQPPTLRVVPTKMTMDMHMVGAMYAPSDEITLMAMTSYIKKDMDHVTFRGGKGAVIRGGFNTQTSGLGDTRLSALIKLNEQWHATVGVSLPTGSIDESGKILAPTGATPSPRLPYPMQLGSGTYDLLAGLTYSSSNHHSDLGWGAQWASVIRTGSNDESYTLGDEHKVSVWSDYQFSHRVSTSLRLNYMQRDNIDGIDAKIAAPVQTADPSNHAVQRIDASAGVNWLLAGHKHRLALELSKPIWQDLDGPQLKVRATTTVGWQYAF